MSLPEGWRECLLSDYVIIKNGFAFKSKDYQDDGIPLIRISEIQNQKITIEKAVRVSKDLASDNFKIEKGDLLIAMSGATTGKVGVYYEDTYVLQNQRVGNIKLKDENNGDKKFRNYLIQSLSDKILDIAYGGAQPNISPKVLGNIKIILPLLKEQKQIAQKLEQVLARVERIKIALDNMPDTIKRFRQSVLAMATSGGLSEGKGWKKLILNDVILEKPRNGYSPKGVNYETKIKNLTLTATTSGKFKGEYFKYLDIEIDDDSYLWLEEGDILVQRANTLEYVGMSAIYNGEKNTYIYPDLMMKIKSNPNKIENKYLHYILLSHGTRQYFRSNATGTSGNMPKINQKVLMATPLLLPPLEEQKAIVKKVETLFVLADNLEEKVNQAQKRVDRLTQSILAKAFRGEL